MERERHRARHARDVADLDGDTTDWIPRAHPLVQRIAARARQQDLSHATLARRIGVSRDTIRKWFAGSREPNLSRLEQLGEAVDLHELGFAAPQGCDPTDDHQQRHPGGHP